MAVYEVVRSANLPFFPVSRFQIQKLHDQQIFTSRDHMISMRNWRLWHLMEQFSDTESGIHE